MPSALETLVKILKLERDLGCADKAVIGGLRAFAQNWVKDAHAQARKPEHHALVDELAGLLSNYTDLSGTDSRDQAIKYMIGRITGRVAPSSGNLPVPPTPPVTESVAEPVPESIPTPDASPEVIDPPQPRRDPPQGRNPFREKRLERRPRESQPPPEGNKGSKKETERETYPDRGGQRGRPAPPQEPEDAGDDLFSKGGEIRPTDDPYAPFTGSVINIPQTPDPARVFRPPRKARAPRDQSREAAYFRRLDAPITTLKGIGPKIGEKLAALDLHTVRDWLYLFPRRYLDYTRMTPIRRLEPGQLTTVAGTVRNAVIIKGRRGVDVLNVILDDGTGTLTASFFGQPYLISKFPRGEQVVFSGKTGIYQGRITLDNPEWEPIEQEALHTRKMIPVYPLTKGLSAHAMRRLSAKVVGMFADDMPDYLPQSVLDRLEMADLGWSLRQLHFPDSEEARRHARQRIAFDELILLQLGMLRNRRVWQSQPGLALEVQDQWLEGALAALPFQLTGAQRRAIEIIREDLARTLPMNRLLQGDVGAGKTAVAAAALLIAVMSGAQGAIMAPTSILAEQHYRGISRLIQAMTRSLVPEESENPQSGEPLVKVALLTGATPAAERAELLAALREGRIHILIGTHALIQEGVEFERLGLAVIDEQHRFGVEQRGALRGKGTNPHLLVMTATPIPRTLALTVHADLDYTVLDEMPPGRTPIQTRLLTSGEREISYRFIRGHLEKGRQAFIVYPLIESDENKESRAAVSEYERLQKEVFPDRRLGLLHGRMSPSQKDGIMNAFSRGEIDVLISTTVVEVGIDVPNASVILIEGANRFGLAQLHQLRGRVGRGQHPGFCILLPDGEGGTERLEVMEETNDGFVLAQKDLEQRGAGELFGTRQSGEGLKMGEYMNPALVELAQLEARTLYAEDPDLSLPEHDLLRTQIERIFGVTSGGDVS
ncbi:MAG: ATP-dependent DNA helicase RecG [Anaerolinea sp.]|nr:ATP-dependent DNA helicase RecG [Anaerolinea sp.]